MSATVSSTTCSLHTRVSHRIISSPSFPTQTSKAPNERPGMKRHKRKGERRESVCGNVFFRDSRNSPRALNRLLLEVPW